MAKKFGRKEVVVRGPKGLFVSAEREGRSVRIRIWEKYKDKAGNEALLPIAELSPKAVEALDLRFKVAVERALRQVNGGSSGE